MYPPGHIAVNLLLVASVNRIVQKTGQTEWYLPFWPAFLTALVPDITDKVLCDYWHLAPYGRNWMHNLTAVALCSLAACGIMPSRHVGTSWAVGHMGHLLGDFAFVPWLWPLFEYNWPLDRRQIAQGVVQTVVDLSQGHALSAKAAVIWNGGRLWLETLFFLATVLAFRKGLRNAPHKVFVYFSIIFWLAIAILYDREPFLWSWTHFGIR